MQQPQSILTPVTLELGGKSPCFVDENFNINWGIKRLVWGNLLMLDKLVLHLIMYW